jgi:hypothetical protein
MSIRLQVCRPSASPLRAWFWSLIVLPPGMPTTAADSDRVTTFFSYSRCPVGNLRTICSGLCRFLVAMICARRGDRTLTRLVAQPTGVGPAKPRVFRVAAPRPCAKRFSDSNLMRKETDRSKRTDWQTIRSLLD